MHEEHGRQGTRPTRRGGHLARYSAAAGLVAALIGVGAVAAASSGDAVDAGSGTASSGGAASAGPRPAGSARVAELRSLYTTAATCLEGQGYTVVGPIPRSNGLGMTYTMTSPPGAPELEEPNACERSLDQPVMDFVSSPVEDQRQLVVEFNALMTCLAVDRPQLSTTPAGPARDANGDGLLDRTDGAFAEDPEAEQAVLDVLRRSPDLEPRCAG